MAYILLTKNKIALVDLEDYDNLIPMKWSYTQNGKNGYAIYGGSNRRIYMHRLLTNAQPGECVDHINGDSLDNRRRNLRICDKSVNNRNRKNVKGYSKAVSYYKTKSGELRQAVGWVAETKLKDTRIRRYFNSEEEAKAFASTFTR